jgi:hypothetical protein
MTTRCPGQDLRYWKPEDICYVPCPHCGGEIEFWRDEPVRACPDCAAEVRHPQLDLGCASWCRFAETCAGTEPEDRADHASTAQQQAIEQARDQLRASDLTRAAEHGGLTGDDTGLDVPVLDSRYRVTLTGLSVYPVEGDAAHPVDELLILRYLAHAAVQPVKPLGQVIAFRELPGGTFYKTALARRTTELLVGTFGNDTDALGRALEAFPARPLEISGADVARRVQGIGHLDLMLIYRAGDEELPPSADILYDRIIGRVFRTDEVAALTTRLCLGLRKRATPS